MNSPPTAISEVQAKEKEAKRAYQREYRTNQARIRRKKKKDAKEFMEKCPKTSRDIVPIRQARAAKRAALKVPSAYQLYVDLIEKLKTFSGDFQKQQSLLVQWGKLRWTEHRRLPLLRLEQSTGPKREERHFTMQILGSADWEDMLEVKASTLTSSQPGLGLFACRPFQLGAVISLYGGVKLEGVPPPKEFGAEYHMWSSALKLVVDAGGPVDQAAPFLGAQMVNDPTWLPPFIPGEEPPKQSSLESMANCKFCNDFTLVATKPIKKGQEFLILYNFLEDDSEDSEEEKEESNDDTDTESEEEK
jgi:hypothetical protein